LDKVEYIFCINPGRSGSEYLCRLFAAAENCAAVHEPLPVCNGAAMQAFLHGRSGPLDRLMPDKMASIAAIKGEKAVYAETNNCFIKGFGWRIPEQVEQTRIGVVMLRRNQEAIVQSYLRIGVSCLTNTGRKWHILPSKPAPLIEPPVRIFDAALTYQLARWLAGPFRNSKMRRVFGLRRMSFVPRWVSRYEADAIRWYVQETWAMAEAFKTRFPKIRCYETDVSALNELQKVQEMFAFFGLEPSATLPSVVGIATNLKSHRVPAGDGPMSG